LDGRYIIEKLNVASKQFTKNGIDVTTWLCDPPSKKKSQRQTYPGRFIHNLKKFYPYENKKVLSMFSGSSNLGDTTDIRPETNADIIAPYDNLPIDDNTYDMVIADPPYNQLFAKEWKADFPKPKRILEEATRIVRSGGLILILHCIIVPNYKHCACERIAIHPILCGPNNAIRVLTVFRKE